MTTNGQRDQIITELNNTNSKAVDNTVGQLKIVVSHSHPPKHIFYFKDIEQLNIYRRVG
jgi:hypothetical protein